MIDQMESLPSEMGRKTEVKNKRRRFQNSVQYEK